MSWTCRADRSHLLYCTRATHVTRVTRATLALPLLSRAATLPRLLRIQVHTAAHVRVAAGRGTWTVCAAEPSSQCLEPRGWLCVAYVYVVCLAVQCT